MSLKMPLFKTSIASDQRHVLWLFRLSRPQIAPTNPTPTTAAAGRAGLGDHACLTDDTGRLGRRQRLVEPGLYRRTGVAADLSIKGLRKARQLLHRMGPCACTQTDQ